MGDSNVHSMFLSLGRDIIPVWFDSLVYSISLNILCIEFSAMLVTILSDNCLAMIVMFGDI